MIVEILLGVIAVLLCVVIYQLWVVCEGQSIILRWIEQATKRAAP